MTNKASKPAKKTGHISTEEIHEFFDENPEIKLQNLDSMILTKLIVHCLDQCIADSSGNPPQFMIQDGFILLEIETKKFSIAIKNNSLYS